MKFKVFLKIFAICFSSILGVFAAGYGIMYAAGTFAEPVVKPENISFEFSEYNVDGDFTAKVISTTANVTETKVTLSLITSEKINTTSDGLWTDGVIAIPKTVQIGTEFVVKVVKKVSDSEVNGLSWIAGGHSSIKAVSSNQLITHATTNVNVDVPVYSISLTTRADSEDSTNTNSFVVNSSLYADVTFVPARSAYRFSNDGENGTTAIYKTTYITTLTNYESFISQVGYSNQFNTLKIADDVKINAYCFTTAIIEDNVLRLYENKEESAKYNSVLSELESMVNDNSSLNKQAVTTQKSIEIVDVNVDSIVSNSNLKNVPIDTEISLFANKNINSDDNLLNLGIVLSSSVNQGVSLQSKLKNVGIRFLIKQGITTHDVVNNADSSLNLIKMLAGGYGKVITHVNADGDTEYYFTPVEVASNVNHSYWSFTVTETVDADDFIIEVKYFDGDTALGNISKSFGTKQAVSNPVSWENLYDDNGEGINLKIYDSPNTSNIQYDEFDLSKNTNVPLNNLYQTKRYFAYSESGEDLTQFIYCSAGKQYNSISQGQDLTLYEISGGLIKPKSVNSHNHSFRVLFVTVETNYKGEVKYDDSGNYIIDRFSQNEAGILSSIKIHITKTVRSLTTNLIPNSEIELIKNGKKIVYVQGTSNPFDINVSSSYNTTTENEIFRTAIANGDIMVVAKIAETETNLVDTLSVTEDTSIPTQPRYVFSMKINELPAGNNSSVVVLFLRYVKSATVTEDIPILNFTETTPTGTIQSSFDGVEVYSGKAVKFKFNLNDVSEIGGYVNNDANRIQVVSEIESITYPYVSSITTTYKIGTKDIEQDLFTAISDTELDYTKIKILLLDEYGNRPLNSSYSLRSTNTRVMLVTGDTVTFVDAGTANLELVDGDGVVRDVLYFRCNESGKVVNVSKMNETINNHTATVSSVEEYSFDTMQEPYAFSQLTIQVVGYKGQTIHLSDTTNLVNLIEYWYQDSQSNIYNLTGIINFRFRTEDEERDKLVQFSDNTIMFLADFGQRKSVEIVAEVPELGIVQIIVLDIMPNVIVTLNPMYNSEVDLLDGAYVYRGVYAESDFNVSVSFEYVVSAGDNVIVDTSKYSLFVEGIILSETTNAYGKIDFNNFGRDDLNNSLIDTTVKINFKDPSNFTKLILTLKKKTESNIYDVFKTFYVYLNPNIKVDSVSQDILYLSENKELTIYNQADSPIHLARIIGAQVLGMPIEFQVHPSDASLFTITGNVLKSISTLSSPTKVRIKVLYNSFNVMRGATQGGLDYYIELTVSPDIRVDVSTNNFILYNGVYHLKLINGTTFASDAEFELHIKNSFTYSSDIGDVQLNIEQFKNSSYVLLGSNVLISGFQDRIITSFTLTLILNNGDSLNFPIILTPIDFPFVNYGDFDDATNNELLDLANILNEDFLKENLHIAYELTNAGNPSGTQIVFSDIVSNLGIREIPNTPIYSVKNVNSTDLYSYASIDENGNLTTVAVGKDTYIIVNTVLSIASGALRIPYLVKIKAELSLKLYYPYVVGETESESIEGINLVAQNNPYTMEYLSFVGNSASVDLFSDFQSQIPNADSSISGKRFSIARTFIEAGQQKVQDVTGSQLLIIYEIAEVWAYNAITGWVKPTTIAQYAAFNTTGTKSILTITKGSAISVRVKVKISTQNGVEGYYYISAGEIPELILKQVTQSGTIDVQDLDIEAGREYDNIISSYNLSLTANGITNNATDLLEYFALDEFVTVDKTLKTITTNSSVKDLNTQMVVYTKYGPLKIINVIVRSNYKVYDYSTDQLKYEDDIYSASIYNFNNNIKIKKDTQTLADWNITDIVFTGGQPQFALVNSDKTITFGAVDAKITIRFTVVTDILENGEYFSFDYTLVLNPEIKTGMHLASVISEYNPYDVATPFTAGESGIEVGKLENLFTLQSNRDWNDLKGGSFSITIINGQLALLNIDISNGDIFVDFANISATTIVLLRVSFTNLTNDGKQFSSYIRLTVNPKFSVTINYPKAQEESGFTPTSELFFTGAEGVGGGLQLFNLNEVPLIGLSKRVVVTDKDGNEYISNVKFTITSSDPLASLLVGGVQYTGSEVAIDQNVTINLTQVGLGRAEISFNIIVDGIPSAIYQITAYSEIDKVYSTSNKNINTTSINKTNRIDNPELIYITENDAYLFNTVTFTYMVKQQLPEGSYFNVFIGGISLENQQQIVESDYLNDRTITIILPDTLKNATTNTLSIKVFDNNGVEIQSETEIITAKALTPRISLYYNGELVDFIKTYKVLLNKNSWTYSGTGEIEDGQIISSELNLAGTRLTYYHFNYLFNVSFASTTLTIENNRVYSFIQNDAAAALQNYFGTFGMSKLSSAQKYTKSMFTSGSIAISIELTGIQTFNLSNEPVPNRGFLTFEAYENEDDCVYDYLIIAQGAPNDPVKVIVPFKVSFGTLYKIIRFEITVKHDYDTISLTNHDGTPNTETNPFVVANNLIYTNRYCTLLFAYYDDLRQMENNIFILHKNNPSFNAGARFNVEYIQGEDYSNQIQQDGLLDLILRFQKAEFGDKTIVIKLSDRYGFTLYYYIKIQATANPVYNGNDISVYEEDYVNIYNITSGPISVGTDYVDVAISGLGSLIIADLSPTMSFYKYIETAPEGSKYQLIDVFDSTPYNKAKLLEQSMFASGNIYGKLIIRLTGFGEIAEISIGMTLKQKYTVEVSPENYVRDNVDFNLLDVVNIYDNKNAVSIGQRELTNVNTFKATFVEGAGLAGNPDDYENNGLMLALKVKLKTSSDYQLFALDSFNKSSKSLHMIMQNLFYGMTNISNYDISLVYYDENGIEKSVKVSGTSNTLFVTEVEQIGEFTYTYTLDGGTQTSVTFKLKLSILLDQMLTIGVQKITSGSHFITLLFDDINNSTLKIPCTTTEVLVYSLCAENIISSGNYVSFLYKNGTDDTTIITNGMSLSDLARLKRITFAHEVTAGVYGPATNIGKLALDSSNLLTNAVLGIKYQQRNEGYRITYNGNMTHDVLIPFFVTLRYIKVDTLYAYGSSNLKVLYVSESKVEETGELTGEVSFDLDKWAGGHGVYDAFKLVAGYSNVANYAKKTERLDFVSNTTAGSAWLTFKLASISNVNVADQNNYVMLDSNNKLTFKNQFNAINNHITLDVYVCFANDPSRTEKIGSVVLALSRANPQVAVANSQNQTGSINYVLANAVSNQEYQTTIDNILNAITIRGEFDSSWTGQDIHALDVVLRIGGADYSLDYAYNINMQGGTIEIALTSGSGNVIYFKNPVTGQFTSSTLTLTATMQKIMSAEDRRSNTAQNITIEQQTDLESQIKQKILYSYNFYDLNGKLADIAISDLNWSGANDEGLVISLTGAVTSFDPSAFFKTYELKLEYVYKDNTNVEIRSVIASSIKIDVYIPNNANITLNTSVNNNIADTGIFDLSFTYRDVSQMSSTMSVSLDYLRVAYMTYDINTYDYKLVLGTANYGYYYHNGEFSFDDQTLELTTSENPNGKIIVIEIEGVKYAYMLFASDAQSFVTVTSLSKLANYLYGVNEGLLMFKYDYTEFKQVEGTIGKFELLEYKGGQIEFGIYAEGTFIKIFTINVVAPEEPA